jgi:6-phosphogluconolactonase
MPPQVVVLEDLDAIGREAAVRVRRAAAAAIAARGRWRVALAGGSTPRGLYRSLSLPGPGGAVDPIDWGRVDVFFGDERSVPPGHPESNYGMVRDALLARIAIPPAQVHRMEGEAADLDAAAARYEAQLLAGTAASGAPGDATLDLALLGMGGDGHTASLFPGTTALAEQRRLCVAVQVPKLATTRLTLTYPVFERAREVMFLIAGSDKARVLREVIEEADQPSRLPSQRIMRRSGPVTVLCDRAAASELPTEVI